MSTLPFSKWCETAADATFSDLAECSQRADSFERKVKRRNWLEYVVGFIMIPLFGAGSVGAAWEGELFIAASMAAIALGVIVVLWNLHRRASNLVRVPEDPCLIHLKRQYSHQYAALRAVPIWYIGPIVPGVLLFYFAVMAGVAEKIGWAAAAAGTAGSAAISFGIFGIVALLNWNAARLLKRKIDAIDALA